MKVAVLDCGSNTFNLLVAEATQSGWSTVFKNKLPVKLGAGGYINGEITQDRFYRGMDALLAHSMNIRNYGCEQVFAYATSAIRDAANGRLFVEKGRALTGIHIEIIDGDREAELICAGVLQTIPPCDEPFLIMDIGGGSTEFIMVKERSIVWKHSFKLGVSRLCDFFPPSDPITPQEIHEIENLLRAELFSLASALDQWKPTRLIGSSGSFDTLLELYLYSDNAHAPMEKSNIISLSAIPSIYQWVCNSTFNQRLKHPVIPAIRAEYMPMAMVLLNFVLSMYPFKQLYQSCYSLKEGAIHEIIQRIDWPSEIDAEHESPEDYLEA